MANRCVSLDSTWSHLPAPAPSLWPHATWFSPAAATFENDALASALIRASMSPSSARASSPTPSTSTVSSSAFELSSIPHCAPTPPLSCRPCPATRSQTRRPCTGLVSKRKPRVSRRAPTTYISADPADFRRMVQEITGLTVPGTEHASAAASPAAQPRPAALPFVLPTLDTSAFFLSDRAPAPRQREEDKTSGGAATSTMAAAAAAAGADDSSLLLQELEAMVSASAVVPAFPTLESWGMI